MGKLDFARQSTVAIDTSAVIYSVEKIEPYFSLLLPVWAAHDRRDIQLIGSELLLLETLVAPMRKRDFLLESLYRDLLTSAVGFQLVPISSTILIEAARHRANYGLHTPDAIHIASAMSAGCVCFITNDKSLARVKDLQILVLSELL